LTPASAGGLTIPQTLPQRAGKAVVEQHLDLADALANFPEWIIDHRRHRNPTRRPVPLVLPAARVV
jgi:hypothetical protein